MPVPLLFPLPCGFVAGEPWKLVSLNVDVIYAAGGTPGRAAKAATSTIPIVTLSSDMIGQGLVSNL